MPLDAPAAGDTTAAPDLAASDAYQRRIAAQQQALQMEQDKQKMLETQMQQQDQAQKMAGDVTAWTQKSQYQVPWAQAPAEAKSHFGFDIYGNESAAAPELWNANVQAQTGKVVAPIQPITPAMKMEGAKLGVAPMENESADDYTARVAAARGNFPDEQLQKELRDNGLSPYKDDGTMKTSAEATAELLKNNNTTGALPQAQQQAADRIMQQYGNHHAYIEAEKQATSAQNFFATLQQGLDNPNLANNMAIMEAFQKVQNPGATVRQQTMKMYVDGQSLLQRANLEYQAGHFEEGQKLTKQFVQEASQVMRQEIAAQNQQFKGTVMKMFQDRMRRRGINEDAIGDLQSPLDPIDQQINGGGAPAQGTQGDQPVKVNSQAEYDALPSGTKYTDSNGVTTIKR